MVTQTKTTSAHKKFGTLLGVYIPTFLMLFGVIFYLRLSWITGHAGLPKMTVIVTFSSLIALLTILSLSSIATNIDIGKGGVYYIVSRSLGIEAGYSIGLPLYFRQILSVSFSVIGFADSLHTLLPFLHVTLIGIFTLCAVGAMAYYSLKGTLNVQLIIFLILIASILSIFLGKQVSPTSVYASPIPSGTTLSFWALFALFFPSMTGMESSVALSGDLKNPARSLPIGTIAALFTAFILNLALPIFLTKHISLSRLTSDPLILRDISRFTSLFFLGIWAASLSTAIGSIIGASKTLHALAADGVVPKLFAKTKEHSSTPSIATIISCLFALIGIYFGSLNAIAPFLTIISLICYFVLNSSVGLEALMSNPSWRPRFRIHWSISLITALLCLFVMLMIAPGTTILSFLLIATLFVIAKFHVHKVSWEDLRTGMFFYFIRRSIYRLSYDKQIAKAWRPHFLIFTKGIQTHPSNLVLFSEAVSQSKGFLTLSLFASRKGQSEEKIRHLCRLLSQNLKNKHIHALVRLHPTEHITTKIHSTIDYHGLGPLSPNTIVLGSLVQTLDPLELAGIIHHAYAKQDNIILMNEIEEKNTTNQDIHIWWDDTHEDNTEFMLVLGYMLQHHSSWNHARLCIKAFAKNDSELRGKEAHFHNLSIKKRLPWNTEILINTDKHAFLYPPIESHSTNARLIFISLRPPLPNESNESYAAYLTSLAPYFKNALPTAFVLTSESTPLDNILQ